MAETTLEERVAALGVVQAQQGERAEALAAELGRAIFDRIIELYGRRDDRSIGFEMWLSGAFDTDGSPVLFETDPKLVELANMVDTTQGMLHGRHRVAKIVNEHLLGAGHEFGIHDRFIEAVPLTGRRLGWGWRGNPPTD